MPQTVAAIFESESQANQARAELISLGIPSDDIFVRNDTGQAQYTSPTQDVDEDTGGIGGFFKRLFGFDDDDDNRATYYSRAISEGRYLVAVDASTEDQAERAADMMQRLGALDIDDDIDDLDVSQSTARQGAGAGAAAMSSSDTVQKSAPLSEGDSVLRSAPPSSADASLQGREKLSVVEEDLQIGKRTVQRGGVRVYARAYDIPVEEKIRLREKHSETVQDKVRRTDGRVEQLAAEDKPLHPHLETMEDDPYLSPDKPKQQR